MNVFIGSGKLVRNAVVNGTANKAMKFTIAAGCNSKKAKVEFVPCVLFNPPKELEILLTQEGKGVLVKIQGRVSTSKFEVNGEVKYRTQVIVEKGNLNIVGS